LNVEIVTIGDELLLGFTIDTNGAHLSRALAESGVAADFKRTVASSGDLGVTFGYIRPNAPQPGPPQPFPFFTIWKRDPRAYRSQAAERTVDWRRCPLLSRWWFLDGARMQRRLSAKKWLTAFPLAVLTLIVSTAAVAPRQCQVVKEWVASLVRTGSLPTELSAFAKYSRPYQREIYRNLTAAQRANLWHAHFSRFTAPGTELTPAQKAFVVSVDQRLDSVLALPQDSRLKHIRKYWEPTIQRSRVHNKSTPQSDDFPDANCTGILAPPL
jgi:hypothetical protein